MRLPDLDLYLAHAFINCPGIWAQLAARGADRTAAEATYQRIRGDYTGNVEEWTLARYTDWYGPPSSRKDNAYLWSLALWPDHQWRCDQIEYNLKPLLIRAGIELRTPRQVARITPLTLAAATDVLRIGYDTRHEVQSALGDPDESEGGWSPQDDLLYDLPDGSVLHCVMQHGILVQIEQLPERPSWAPRNPSS